MADSNIAGLPAGAAITNTDLIAGSDAGSGTLVKKTGLQFNTYIQNNLSNLPTTDPHLLGMLWNNGGLVAISQPFTRALAGNTGTYALTGHAATIVAATWIGPTWSPTDHTEFYTISGTHNETATRNSTFGGTSTLGRSDTAQTTGTRDVFILIGQMGGAGFLVGVANGAEVTYVGATNNSFGYWSNGNTFTNAGFGAVTPPTYTTGDTIGIRADLDLNTVAFNKNGAAWSATSSIALLRPSSDPIFIAVTLTDSLNDTVSILNQ